MQPPAAAMPLKSMQYPALANQYPYSARPMFFSSDYAMVYINLAAPTSPAAISVACGHMQMSPQAMAQAAPTTLILKTDPQIDPPALALPPLALCRKFPSDYPHTLSQVSPRQAHLNRR